jgi:osmotically-inducible protein OsmY
MTVSTRSHGIGRWLLIGVLACGLPAMVGCQTYREGEGRTAGQVTDDLAIQTSVKSRLVADKGLSGFQIQTEVYKGAVTLYGRVPDEASRNQALQIARGVKGVVSVEDRLTIVTD